MQNLGRGKWVNEKLKWPDPSNLFNNGVIFIFPLGKSWEKEIKGGKTHFSVGHIEEPAGVVFVRSSEWAEFAQSATKPMEKQKKVLFSIASEWWMDGCIFRWERQRLHFYCRLSTYCLALVVVVVRIKTVASRISPNSWMGKTRRNKNSPVFFYIRFTLLKTTSGLHFFPEKKERELNYELNFLRFFFSCVNC